MKVENEGKEVDEECVLVSYNVKGRKMYMINDGWMVCLVTTNEPLCLTLHPYWVECV